MSNFLVKSGIISAHSKSRAAEIVAEAIADPSDQPDLAPHEFINWALTRIRLVSDDATIAGQVFELLISTLFVRVGLMPFYIQTQVSLVPDINFDMLLWTSEVGPIAISLKTSLRERYKQADLEAMALKSVHRLSKTHLITLDENEAERLRKKIIAGDVQNLSSVTTATTRQLDQLMASMAQFSIVEAPTLPLVRSYRGLVTA